MNFPESKRSQPSLVNRPWFWNFLQPYPHVDPLSPGSTQYAQLNEILSTDKGPPAPTGYLIVCVHPLSSFINSMTHRFLHTVYLAINLLTMQLRHELL